jgi:hypothetical protein
MAESERAAVCVVTFKHLALPGTLSGPAETAGVCVSLEFIRAI